MISHRFVAAAALACCLAAAGCGHDSGGKTPAGAGGDTPSPSVQVAGVREGSIQQELPVTGTLVALPTREVTITPPVAGVLDRVAVHLGQTVRAGDLIAHVSVSQIQGQIQQSQATVQQDELQVQQAQVSATQQRAQTGSAIHQAESALAEAKATLAEAQATLLGDQAALENAKQNLDRERSLLKDGLVADKDVQAAEFALRTAQAQVDAQHQAVDAQKHHVDSESHALAAAETGKLQDEVKQKDVEVARQQVRNARGALATTAAQIALHTIRAPLTGVVTSLSAAPGQTVDTSSKLATVANLDQLQLQLAVPSESSHVVRPGQTVLFQVDNLPGKTFACTIQTVGQQVDPASNTVQVLATVPNPHHLLRDDTTVRARIVTKRHDHAILAPKNAVLLDPSGKASVIVIGANRVAHRRPVTIGITQDSTIEIISGVEPGEQVAVTGNYSLPDGTKVTVANSTGSAH